MPSPTAWMAVVKREDLEVALAVGAAAAAGVEQAAVAGPLAAEARVLARGQRGGAVVVAAPGPAGPGRRRGQLGLHRHLADPVLLERPAGCRGRAASRRTAAPPHPTRCPRTGPAACGPGSWPTRSAPVVPETAPCRPGRTARGCSRRRCRASPAPMPVRSTLPEPSGQPSWSTSRLLVDLAAGCAWRSRTSRRGSASSPVQRQISATMLGNLIVSSVLKSFAMLPSGFVVCESWPN